MYGRWVVRSVGRFFVCCVFVGLGGWLVSGAAAGPYFTSSTSRVARPGQFDTFRGGIGLKVWATLPLYLVPARDSPKFDVTPFVKARPDRAPYLRIGTIDVRHVKGTPAAGYNVAIRFRVPATLAPGAYAYVMYVDFAAKKGEGGLLWLTTSLRPGGWRDTSLVPAGPALLVR